MNTNPGGRRRGGIEWPENKAGLYGIGTASNEEGNCGEVKAGLPKLGKR